MPVHSRSGDTAGPCHVDTCTPEQLSDGQPVEITQDRCHVIYPSGSCNKTSGSVLDSLQSVQQLIAVGMNVFRFRYC